MAKIQHRVLDPNATEDGAGIHTQLGLPDFANESSRLGYTQSASDRGRLAWQLSDGTTWQADGAGGWKEIGGGGGGGGEANTTSNQGGGQGLALAKSGVDLPFKTLTAGANITLTPSADELQIAAVGGGGSGAPYSTVTLFTEADDGTTTSVDTLYLLQPAASDFGLVLPATASLSVGDRVFFLCGNASYRIVISTNDRGGAGLELILGEGNPGSRYHIMAGQLDQYVFEYLGTSLGVPVWNVIARTTPQATPEKAPVQYATTGSLSTFTSSGTDENEVITSTVNGELVVDGQPVQLSDPMRGGILVKNQAGPLGAVNGIYQVIQTGDGANPWIIRRRADWHFSDQTRNGTEVQVAADIGADGWSGSNYGKIYVTRANLAVGTHATEDFGDRNRIEDFADDETATTSGAATAVTTTINTIKNDTSLSVRVRTIGVDDTNNDTNVYVDEIVIKRDGGGAVTVEQVDAVSQYEEMTPASRGVKYQISGNFINIEVQGVAGRDIEWRSQYASMVQILGGG